MAEQMTADARFTARFTAEQSDPTRPITLSALVLPWDVPVQLGWDGSTVGFSRGSVDTSRPERVKFALDHRAGGAEGTHLMGYATALEDTPTGLRATFAIPRDELTDPETAAAVRQMANGIRDAVSVGIDWSSGAETVTAIEGERWATHHQVTAADLLEVSSVAVPRFADARIDSMAASRRPSSAALTNEPDDPEPEDDEPETPEEDMPDVDTAPATDTEAARVVAHRAATATPARLTPRGQFASFGEYVLAERLGQIEPGYAKAIKAALAQQITTDTPGIVPETWVNDVVRLMQGSSVIVESFATRTLPGDGMLLHVPVVTQFPDVGVQTAELAAIATRKMLITGAPFPVKTFAGGQTVSIQEIERTAPSYINEMMLAYVQEMAIARDTYAAAQLAAGTTLTQNISSADPNTGFIAATAQILTGIMRYPDVVVLSVAMWQALGNAKGTDGRPLYPGLSPMNPLGSFDLANGNGNIRGVTYAVAPLLATGGYLGVKEAFRSYLGPVGTLSADVPSTLGRDTAVYQYGAMGVTDARGIVKLVDVALLSADESKAKK